MLHWSDSAGAYLAGDGQPAALPAPGASRAVTLVERQGQPEGPRPGQRGKRPRKRLEKQPMLALVHSPEVLKNPDLLKTVSAALKLAVENERLRGQVEARASGAASPDIFLRGVPSGEATATPLRLSLADAVKRGLDNNLGGLIEAQRVRAAEGTRRRGLGDVLPHLSANLRQSEQLVNIAAYGFTGFAGIPLLIGPYGVFDARIAVSAPILDTSAFRTLQAETANLRAEQFTYQSAREEIVLVVANLYLQAVADASRVRATRSQVSTAETVARLAEDQRASGLVAGIEVLRQQVELAAARQRLIAADAAAEKDKLALARAIGLPAGQPIELADAIPFAAAPSLTLEQATEQADAERDDLHGALARVEAARAARQAAAGYALPTVHLDADYGALGASISTTKYTYGVAATVRVPLFEGGATRGRIDQADAELRQREAELADLRGGIHYQVARQPCWI